MVNVLNLLLKNAVMGLAEKWMEFIGNIFKKKEKKEISDDSQNSTESAEMQNANMSDYKKNLNQLDTQIKSGKVKNEVINNYDELYDQNYENFDRDIKQWEAIPFERIRSHGRIIKTNSKGKTMSYCSTTVQKDAEKIFNIPLSRGHGSAQWEIDHYNTMGRTPSCNLEWKDLQGKLPQIMSKFKGDVFDIFTKSNDNPKYNHRLLGFRLWTGGKQQIRVLDSYIRGVGSNSPIPFEEYYEKVCIGMKRPLLKVVGFDTKREVFLSQTITNNKTKEAKNEIKSA